MDILIPEPVSGDSEETRKKKSAGGKKGAKISKQRQAARELTPTVAALVNGVFAMLAAKNPVWTVTEAEVNNIAEPAARILARFEQAEQASEYADYVALLVAVAGVVGPRIILTQSMKPKEGGKDDSRGTKPDKTKDGSGNGPISGRRAAANAGSVKSELPGITFQ